MYRKGSLFPYIASMQSSMTKAEQNVLTIIQERPEDCIYYSISDLALQANVSDTSVMRCCRTLGFKGYQDFKLALAQEMILNGPSFSDVVPVSAGDSAEQLVKKTIMVSIKSLQDTESLLRVPDVVAAVEMMENAKRIILLGVGSSYLTVQNAKYKFLRIGLAMDCMPDGHMQAMMAAQCKKGDLVFAVSQSGSSTDTVNALALAHSRGASTVCLTHHQRSPITKSADIVLLTGYAEDPLDGGAFASLISQEIVLDALYSLYFQRNEKKASKIRDLTAESIADKLY